MKSASYTVPGPPHGKGRPRFVRKTGRTYTPTTTVDYELMARQAAALSMGMPGSWTGPFGVTIRSFKERPAKLNRKADPDYPILCPKKVDADNCAKAILDSLAPWIKDERVVQLYVETWYAARGAAPCVDVDVFEIDEKKSPWELAQDFVTWLMRTRSRYMPAAMKGAK